MITLGQASNYSAGQVWRHLWAWGTKRDFTQLRQELAERYHTSSEQVLLYHTGRSALTAAIKSVAPGGGKKVIIPGLTCIAVVRAVKAANCTPVFVDITAKNLEYDYDKLTRTLAEIADFTDKKANHLADNPDFKGKTTNSATAIDKKDNVCYNGSIILVQNTLGFSWNVSKIEQIAQKYHALIVEDLAHSAGRFYADGREAGTVGAAAALSFGKGKAIDTISGGAAILRSSASASSNVVSATSPASSKATAPSTHSEAAPSLVQPTHRPKLADRWRDRWYPVFGAISRGLGQGGCKFMGGLVRLHFVQRSADAELNLDHRLTYWQAKLASRQLQRLSAAPLREYRLVRDRQQVLKELHRRGYYLDEIWYDTPVSPERYYQEAQFPEAKCPNTVKIAQQIVNLPTWYASDKIAPARKLIEESEIK